MRPHENEIGITLIELLIAITLTSIISTALAIDDDIDNDAEAPFDAKIKIFGRDPGGIF